MPIATPNDLAQQLATIARKIASAVQAILSSEEDHSSLHQQFASYRQTLFHAITPAEFADMYAQTLVYGVFVARVIQHNHLMLPRWFPQFAGCDNDERIARFVDDCTRLLEHTDMSEVLKDFGKATKQEDPILHFYETFLSAYDSKTRDMRGVFYTPEPVVSYMVRSVDHLLQTTFHKPMGLADEAVTILDPATGTATFLHTVVQHIYRTLHAMGKADMWNDYVPDNLLPRLHGFELLMAPCMIAHLKLGMLLQELGYTCDSNERLGISLTNALADAAIGLYPTHPVMVVLGNPPYANYGMLNKGKWIQEQLDDYKRGLNEKKLNLDDDCIKFMRFGQWCIDQAGQGILTFITNNTYIDGITHRRMRESLLETFTDIYILDLHGSRLKREICPDGSRDENVFAIQQGVAIGMFIKEPGKTGLGKVHHAEIWGSRASKYTTLSENTISSIAWNTITLGQKWFFFVPKQFDIADEYHPLQQLTDIFLVQQNGIKTDRDGLFFDVDYSTLKERMQTFYSDEGLLSPFQEIYRVQNSSSYNILSRRSKTTFNHQAIRRALYRPFDVQWLYYAPDMTSRPAWDVMRHMLAGDNIALLGMRQYEYEVQNYCYVLVTEHITESRVFISNRGGASIFPLYLYSGESGTLATPQRQPNFSLAFIKETEQHLGISFISDGSGNLDTTIGPEDVFHYLYAILHSPTYRSRYAEFLKIDFPRIPFPSDKALFKALATKGAVLVDLHLLRLPGSTGIGGAGGAAILSKPNLQGVIQSGMIGTIVEYVRYDEQQQRVLIGKANYVAGIDAETWKMQIGGYRPLHKWLKDRKGRTLSSDDVLHAMRIVVALRETQRVVQEIDEIIPRFPLE